jgi:hypothetical protein
MAEPMQLDDLTPRWVRVQFEDSPGDRPDRLDHVYTPAYRAWLEPDDEGRVTVRVPADVLERDLFLENDPVPGSFSDFVWVFDPASGEVLSASFSGAFLYEIDWGFATTEVRAEVNARMTSDTRGGFRRGTPIFGRRLNRFCRDVERFQCRGVRPSAYDERRGYVNAVGYLEVDSALTKFSTYSAVGEARFSETPTDPAPLEDVEGAPPAVASPPPAL